MIIKTSYPFMKPPPSARLIRGHRSAQGLVGCWLMNEAGGLQVFDLSGNRNTGTFEGSPTWGISPYGSAIDWNGTTSSINCGNLGHPNVFTLIAWIKSPDFSGGYKAIMGRGYFAANPCSYHFVTRTSAGKELLCFSRDGSNQRKLLAISTPLTVNKWHMVAVTWGYGISGTLYIDGISIPLNVQDVYNGIDSGYNTYLGRLVTPNSPGMLGSMSHAMIYNRALSASEIALLYWRPFCMFERRARTALLSGYEVVAPSGIATYTHHYQQQL